MTSVRRRQDYITVCLDTFLFLYQVCRLLVLLVVMVDQSARMLLFSLWVTLICVKGSIRVDPVKAKVHQEGYDQRHRRSPIQGCSVDASPDGYSSLEEDDVNVEFIKNDTTYIARLRWKPPKVNNATPTSFLIHWGVGTWSVSRCKVIKNKTSWDITPWKSDQTLSIAVIPIPTRLKYLAKVLQFHPTNKETSTTPFTKAITASELFTDESPTTEIATTVQSLESGSKPQENPDNSKIIIGSVTGGAIGILLIVIVVILYLKHSNPDPRPPFQGCMYVSYCRETDKFITKVEDFVLWFRENGFDVQMVPNVLSESNALLLREIGRFRFGKQQISQAKNVFLIVSAAYLRLCRLDEKEANKGTLPAEEKFVYAEIVQIYHDILENGFRTDRFIPILFGVKETELPHWIKELTVYTWPEDKTSLLYRLNNLPEYAPLINNSPGENLVRPVGCCKIL